MPKATPSALHAVAFVCASALLAADGTAAEALTAHLADGRTVTGSIDARTDENYLWLRRSGERLDLASGYPWSQVLAGQVETRTLNTPELRTWSMARSVAGRRLAEIATGPADARLPESAGPLQPVQRVKTLVIDAEVAQWDKDAPTDGLRIYVYPLDENGHLVPVQGHIEFTLVVEREYNRGSTRYVDGPEFVEGARRSLPVRPEQFESGPAFYELAFAKWHPDYEPTLADQALLYARLSVPGQGVFEASDARVCLRELSRFRDQLQYYTPGRYLPLEQNSGDGR